MRSIIVLLISICLPSVLFAQSPATDSTAPSASAETEPTDKVTEDTPAEADTGDTQKGMSDLVTDVTWTVNAGGTANLTEGNSSTRTFGATLDGERRGPWQFLTFNGSGQYGVSRVPQRLPAPEAEDEALRTGRPGNWEFDENINNWLIQAKYGAYMSKWQSNYLFASQRFEGNHFSGYWFRSESQVGYGRRFRPGDHFGFRLEAGPVFTEDHLVIDRIRSRMALAAAVLVNWKVSDTATINEELTHLRTVASNDEDADPWLDHRTRSNTSIVVRITEQFQLQTSLGLGYDRNPAPGAHRLDVNMTNAILYSFL